MVTSLESKKQWFLGNVVRAVEPQSIQLIEEEEEEIEER